MCTLTRVDPLALGLVDHSEERTRVTVATLVLSCDSKDHQLRRVTYQESALVTDTQGLMFIITPLCETNSGRGRALVRASAT
eukprot:129114-Rhodomonas_salina.1